MNNLILASVLDKTAYVEPLDALYLALARTGFSEGSPAAFHVCEANISRGVPTAHRISRRAPRGISRGRKAPAIPLPGAFCTFTFPLDYRIIQTKEKPL